MKEIAISILMATYNVENYLEESVNSIINQTFKNWELIIVDDCSKDSTRDIIRRLAGQDNRIRYVFRNENAGSGFIPRSEAFATARYDWITMIDSDDYIEEEYLTTMVNRHLATNADIVMSSLNPDNGDLILPRPEFDVSQVISGREAIKHTLFGWRIPGHCNCLIRSDIYRRVVGGGKYKIDSKSRVADEILFRLMLCEAETVAFTRAKYYYRNNSMSLSRASGNVKRFDDLEASLFLAPIIHGLFPQDSEECRRIELAKFNEVYTCLFYLNRNNFSISEKRDAIQRIKKCYNHVNWTTIKKYTPKIRYYLLKYFGVRCSCIIFRIGDNIRLKLKNRCINIIYCKLV